MDNAENSSGTGKQTEEKPTNSEKSHEHGERCRFFAGVRCQLERLVVTEQNFSGHTNFNPAIGRHRVRWLFGRAPS